MSDAPTGSVWVVVHEEGEYGDYRTGLLSGWWPTRAAAEEAAARAASVNRARGALEFTVVELPAAVGGPALLSGDGGPHWRDEPRASE